MRTDEKLWRNRKGKKELARRLRSENPGLEVVHPHAAGIDGAMERTTWRCGQTVIHSRCAGLNVSLPIFIDWRTGCKFAE